MQKLSILNRPYLIRTAKDSEARTQSFGLSSILRSEEKVIHRNRDSAEHLVRQVSPQRDVVRRVAPQRDNLSRPSLKCVTPLRKDEIVLRFNIGLVLSAASTQTFEILG